MKLEEAKQLLNMNGYILEEKISDNKIDLSIIDKWMPTNLNLTDEGLNEDHWIDKKTGEVYYTWDAAVRFAKKVPGYHLPSPKEWYKLLEACGCIGEKNDPVIVYEDMPPAVGKCYDNLDYFKNKLGIKYIGRFSRQVYGIRNVGDYVSFWTSYDNNDRAWLIQLWNRYNGGKLFTETDYKENGLSVRLVKD